MGLQVDEQICPYCGFEHVEFQIDGYVDTSNCCVWLSLF